MKTSFEKKSHNVTMGSNSKEQAISELCFSLKRNKPFKLNSIEELESSLSPSEILRSFDSISLMKLKSFVAEGNYSQAYIEIRSSLEKDPHNICLQLELKDVLFHIHQHTENLLHENPSEPSVEKYFDILKFESFTGPEISILFLKHLILNRKFVEAFEMAKPLISLYPSHKSLRHNVELLVQHFQHPKLLVYLKGLSECEEVIEYSKKLRTNGEIYELSNAFRKIRNQLDNSETIHKAESLLNEIIGNWPQSKGMDLNLKDFYFLKAVLESKKGNHLEAVFCLQLLTEMDPANIYFQNYLDACTQEAIQTTTELAKKGEFLETLCEFYNYYRKYGMTHYPLIQEVAKQHIKEGRFEIALNLMNELLSLNPVDNDYLIANWEVALFANNKEWSDRIYLCMRETFKMRPWDVKLGSFISEQNN